VEDDWECQKQFKVDNVYSNPKIVTHLMASKKKTGFAACKVYMLFLYFKFLDKESKKITKIRHD